MPSADRQIIWLKKNLKRIERVIKSPYARPADFLLRDRLARRLYEALKSEAA